ncbi:MAG: glycosyltransferase family 2 protein [Acidimicrobiales bacterium]
MLHLERGKPAALTSQLLGRSSSTGPVRAPLEDGEIMTTAHFSNRPAPPSAFTNVPLPLLSKRPRSYQRKWPVDEFALSVVMPAYNESRSVANAVRSVLDLDVPFRLELLVVDDGSTDGTQLALQGIRDDRLVVHRHPVNLGKGAAVLSGAALATGTHLVIFDADSEYLASDLARLAEPIMAGHAAVVFGTRIVGQNTSYQSLSHALGNKLATLMTNVLYNSCLTDMHTCLKMVPLELFRELHLHHHGFGLDTELTGELLRRGYRPFEVPVTYVSRSRAEGKKLTWRDALDCAWVTATVRARGLLKHPVRAISAPVIDLPAIENELAPGGENLDERAATVPLRHSAVTA